MDQDGAESVNGCRRGNRKDRKNTNETESRRRATPKSDIGNIGIEQRRVRSVYRQSIRVE